MIVRVDGIPIPQGSMKAFPYKGKDGRLHTSMIHQKGNKLLDWRSNIANAYINQDGVLHPKEESIKITMTLYIPRPKSVKIKDRPLPNVKPDIDKLERALNDALSGIAYVDDAQICSVIKNKQYADDCEPGVVFIVETI